MTGPIKSNLHSSNLPSSVELTPKISILSSEFPSLSSELAALPSDLQSELKIVGKRVNPQRMKELVKRLCAIQPWKLPELAQLLHRHANYIRQNYLLPLIESNELEYVFPHQPNHPQQAYRTKK